MVAFDNLLGIDLLIDDMQAQLTADGNTAKIVFGQREPARVRINPGPGQANRVVIVPGDEKGNLGDYGPAKRPRGLLGSATPRTLCTWNEQFRIFIWAFDPSEPENERAQYRAARFLHDQIVRAALLSPRISQADLDISKPTLVLGPLERKFGCEIVLLLTLRAKLPDDPGPVAPLDWVPVVPTTGDGVLRLPDDPEADVSPGT